MDASGCWTCWRRSTSAPRFCVIGHQAAAHPRLVADVAAAGHAVANHTYTHRLLPAATPWRIHEEIRRATDAIAAATGGVRPRFFRAPGGAWSREVLAQVRRARPAPARLVGRSPGLVPAGGPARSCRRSRAGPGPDRSFSSTTVAVTAHRPSRRSASRCPGCSIRATGSSSPADRVRARAGGSRRGRPDATRSGPKPASGRREPTGSIEGRPPVSRPRERHVRHHARGGRPPRPAGASGTERRRARSFRRTARRHHRRGRLGSARSPTKT